MTDFDPLVVPLVQNRTLAEVVEVAVNVYTDHILPPGYGVIVASVPMDWPGVARSEPSEIVAVQPFLVSAQFPIETMSHLPSEVAGFSDQFRREVFVQILNAPYRDSDLFAFLTRNGRADRSALSLNTYVVDPEQMTALSYEVPYLDKGKLISGNRRINHFEGDVTQVQAVGDLIEMRAVTEEPNAQWILVPETPTSDPKDQGLRFPSVYGRAKRVRCVNVEVGPTSNLANPVGFGTPEIQLSDDLSDWPASGTVTIDGEVITYTSIVDDSKLEGVSRAQNGTIEAVHKSGAKVYLHSAVKAIASDGPGDVQNVYVRNILNGEIARVNPSYYVPENIQGYTMPDGTLRLVTAIDITEEQLSFILRDMHAQATVTQQAVWESTADTNPITTGTDEPADQFANILYSTSIPLGVNCTWSGLSSLPVSCVTTGSGRVTPYQALRGKWTGSTAIGATDEMTRISFLFAYEVLSVGSAVNSNASMSIRIVGLNQFNPTLPSEFELVEINVGILGARAPFRTDIYQIEQGNTVQDVLNTIEVSIRYTNPVTVGSNHDITMEVTTFEAEYSHRAASTGPSIEQTAPAQIEAASGGIGLEFYADVDWIDGLTQSFTLDHPLDVLLEWLKRGGYDEFTQINTASFNTAKANLPAGAMLGLDARQLGATWSDVLRRLCYETRTNVVWNPQQQEWFFFNADTSGQFPAATSTLTSYSDLLEIHKGENDLRTRLNVLYAYDATAEVIDETAFLGSIQTDPTSTTPVDVPAAEAEFGRLDAAPMFLLAVRDAPTAQDWFDYMSQELARFARIFSLRSDHWEGYELNLGDIVALDIVNRTDGSIRETVPKCRVIETSRDQQRGILLRLVEVL